MPQSQQRRNARRRGRPTVLTLQLADRICRRIAVGESLRAICNGSNYPSKSTVTRWLAENDEFWDRYARAREQQAHALIDEVADLARSADANNAAELRLKIDSLKWAAAKLCPKVYGKVETIGGNQVEDNEPIDADAKEEEWDDTPIMRARRWPR